MAVRMSRGGLPAHTAARATGNRMAAVAKRKRRLRLAVAKGPGDAALGLGPTVAAGALGEGLQGQGEFGFIKVGP